MNQVSVNNITKCSGCSASKNQLKRKDFMLKQPATTSTSELFMSLLIKISLADHIFLVDSKT